MDKELRRKNKLRKKRLILKRVQKREQTAFYIVLAMMMVLELVIFRITLSSGKAYSQAVLDHQSYKSTSIPYKRGQIISSDGTVLAYSEKVYNLILDVKAVLSQEDSEYRTYTVNALVSCFNLDRTEIERVINENPTSQYQRLLRELTSDEIADFIELKADKNNKIAGVWFEESYIRKYPFDTLACDTLGFASAVNGGELGIERQYNEELSGTDGITYSYVGENLDVQETSKPAVDGNNIITTIDYNIQAIVEKNIIAYNADKPSVNTAVMVMNPNNGEILAMASYPNFNLNNPRDLSSLYTEEQLSAMSDEEVTKALYSLWTNFCTSQSYEPGSTFKPFTIASALEEGVVSDGDTYECKGSEEVGPHTIRCHSLSSIGSHGVLTLEESLMNSCNPYMINLAIKLGNVRFAQYIKTFGFGDATGIDLPGETDGIIYDENKMTTIDAATNSFGQNLNVNMVQMLSAYCSIINDGKYYMPHVVKRIESSGGEIIKDYAPSLVRQTVTASTSKLLRQYLESTVTEGTAHRAAVEGYSIAGKTGTAQKLPRDDLKWVISYIGHAPADNPKYAIYIVLDEPSGTTGTQGSTSDALNLARDINTDILPYMGVFKDTDEPYVPPSRLPEESGVDGIPSTNDHTASANN